jgi:hypothetical protein
LLVGIKEEGGGTREEGVRLQGAMRYTRPQLGMRPTILMRQPASLLELEFELELDKTKTYLGQKQSTAASLMHPSVPTACSKQVLTA